MTKVSIASLFAMIMKRIENLIKIFPHFIIYIRGL